jgi:hypothetical protein
MSETEKKNSWWRKLLRCPAVWLAFFWCLRVWVVKHPETLCSLLPTSIYDALEEFAVMHLDGAISRVGFIFLLVSLGLALATPFLGRGHWWKKAGKTLLYLFLALLWLFASLPQLGRVRERAMRISCTSNLKQIYMSLEQYAADSEGFLPPELKTLQESDYLSDSAIYRCPSRTRPNAEFSDYLYFGRDRKLKDPPFLLVRDRDKNHPGVYWNNLLSNGEIRREPEERKP